MTKRIIDNLTYTTYSDTWIHGDKVHTEYEGQENERKVIYRPKAMLIVFKNKHMGIVTDIKNIPDDWNTRRIMQEAIYYAGKNTQNISFPVLIHWMLKKGIAYPTICNMQRLRSNYT